MAVVARLQSAIRCVIFNNQVDSLSVFKMKLSFLYQTNLSTYRHETRVLCSKRDFFSTVAITIRIFHSLYVCDQLPHE